MLPTDEQLVQRRYVTVVLRLLVDSEGHVLQGQAGGANKQQWVRFHGRDGILEAVEASLALELRGEP
jgi:hypothetical protein